jgi:hypothetical protein
MLLGFSLYLCAYVGILMAFNCAMLIAYGLFMGLPILLIGLLVASGMLDFRDRVNPQPAGRTLAIFLFPSGFAIILLHVKFLISIALTPALTLTGILVTANTIAVLVVFGYVEVLRDQFPPQGLRRTDSP